MPNNESAPITKRAFFVMPFGKPDLEEVWRLAYEPVARSLGYDPIRMDEQDNGKVVIDQIINEISTASDVVVGDLTYERPNCYYELGYARGCRKEDEIILCARRDHVDHSSYRPKVFSFEWPMTLKISFLPKHSPPRVHFDLAAFNILIWDLADIDAFKVKLEKGLRERDSLIRARTTIQPGQAAPATKVASVPGVDLTALADEFRENLERS